MISALNGYYMPFEGLKHKGTIIMLPYRDDTWKKEGLVASDTFFKIILFIAKYEMVYVVKDHRVKYDISLIENKKNIQILNIDYNDSWARDPSPIFLKKDNHLIGVDFRFNAWGGSVDGLYDDYQDDDAYASKLCQALNYQTYYVNDFILEGGSIHTNGKGVFLTTKACLLSKGRNPNLTQQQIEDNLKKYLKAEKVIWLEHGIYNDETNEHVDNMCCFYNEDTVLLAFPENKEDIQYQYSLDAYNKLIEEGLKVIKVICPKPIYLTKEDQEDLCLNDYSKSRLGGDRLAASYINFYQSDKYIILPAFGVEEDKIAYEQFKELYPNKEIFQLNTKEVLIGGGNIHCITMQIPEGE